MTAAKTASEQTRLAEEIADAQAHLLVVGGGRPTVHQALSAVMAELPAIGKDSQAPAAMGGFPFRGIEAIASAVRPLLAKHGVVIAPRASITKVVPAPGQKEMWQDVYLEVEWVISGPDGSVLEPLPQTCGIGRDHTDKGANKAQSQAYKYLLLHLFCIADAKDDSDGADYSHAAAPEPVLPDGWGSWDELNQTWDYLRKATSELHDEVIEQTRAKVKALGFTHGTFTKAHADAWVAFLDEAEEHQPADAVKEPDA